MAPAKTTTTAHSADLTLFASTLFSFSTPATPMPKHHSHHRPNRRPTREDSNTRATYGLLLRAHPYRPNLTPRMPTRAGKMHPSLAATQPPSNTTLPAPDSYRQPLVFAKTQPLPGRARHRSPNTHRRIKPLLPSPSALVATPGIHRTAGSRHLYKNRSSRRAQRPVYKLLLSKCKRPSPRNTDYLARRRIA